MDSYIASPFKLMTAGSALALYGLWLRRPELAPPFPSLRFVAAYAVLWTGCVLAWCFYRIMIRPKYLSPLLHLPEPTVSVYSSLVPRGIPLTTLRCERRAEASGMAMRTAPSARRTGPGPLSGKCNFLPAVEGMVLLPGKDGEQKGKRVSMLTRTGTAH